MDINGEPYVKPRIGNACDGCKARKVKCDGKLPCSYCARRQRPHTCRYSPQKRRRTRGAGDDSTHSPSAPLVRQNSGTLSTRQTSPAIGDDGRSPRVRRDGAPSSHGMEVAAEDDTEVPREARLLCDAQGKLIFIGDCAPLSFFQSVRQLITTRVEQHAFAPESSRFSVLEVSQATTSQNADRGRNQSLPEARAAEVGAAVSRYVYATVGVLDLFDNERLREDVQLWASLDRKPEDATTIINYLILAIGLRTSDDEKAQAFFEYARDRALGSLISSISVATVQAFALITMYMLCSCEINGAFLYFGIAVRAAFSVGIHRTEVNTRFGPNIRRQRDRLWKSLRVADLYLSVSMGRPPATSDWDCTVSYKSSDDEGTEIFDLLNASCQILLITEKLVLEIYSQRRISLQLTEGISLQLREWSACWLQRLKDAVAERSRDSTASGACQVLAAYYYAVMLVSRPFLMYELCRNLDNPRIIARNDMATGKSKLADACIDAASLMVDAVQDLIKQDAFRGSMPLLVPWLFASSLVLGVGLLGGFGRILERQCRFSIDALDHFARRNAHAEQYSLIAQSLLSVSLEHLEKKELQERMQRTESSSQLFGLIPPASPAITTPGRSASHIDYTGTPSSILRRRGEGVDRQHLQPNGVGLLTAASPGLGQLDSAFLGLSDQTPDGTDAGYWSSNFGNDADQTSALNLFTLLESGGGIDLAHYL